jgi:hypothetical protein
MYLTIPEITESEELRSVSRGTDGLSFDTVMAASPTAVRLQQANANGELLPLVVLAMEGQILALDSVYVSGFALTTAEGEALAHVSFAAQSVRFA